LKNFYVFTALEVSIRESNMSVHNVRNYLTIKII